MEIYEEISERKNICFIKATGFSYAVCDECRQTSSTSSYGDGRGMSKRMVCGESNDDDETALLPTSTTDHWMTDRQTNE